MMEEDKKKIINKEIREGKNRNKILKKFIKGEKEDKWTNKNIMQKLERIQIYDTTH